MAKKTDLRGKERRAKERIDKEVDKRMKYVSTYSNDTKKDINNIGSITGRYASSNQGYATSEKDASRRGDMAARNMEDITKNANTLLERMGIAVQKLTSGIGDMSKKSIEVSKDVIKQYGQAIGEDININKKNLLTLTISKTTPLVGYAVTKFMETEVYQKAIMKAKEKLSSMFDSVINKVKTGFGFLGGKIKDVFTRKKKKKPEKREKITINKDQLKDIPKAAKGGYAKRGGLAEIHSAEMVTPKGVFRKLGDTMDEIRMSLGSKGVIYKMGEEMRTERAGLFKKFGFHLKRAIVPELKSIEERFLEQIVYLKTGLIGQMGILEEAWGRTMAEHPGLRTLVRLKDPAFWKGIGKLMLIPFKTLLSPILIPVKFLFKKRGTYAGEIPKTGSFFSKIVNILAMIYTTGMHKLDIIGDYLKTIGSDQKKLVEHQTGEYMGKMKEKKKAGWSIARKALRGVAAPIEYGIKKYASEKTADKWTMGRKDFKHKYKMKELLAEQKSSAGKLKQKMLTEGIKDAICESSCLNPVEFTWSTVERKRQNKKDVKLLKGRDELINVSKKSNKIALKQSSKLDALKRRMGGIGKKIWGWVMMAIGLAKSFFGNILGKLGLLKHLTKLAGITKLLGKIPGVKAVKDLAKKGIGGVVKGGKWLGQKAKGLWSKGGKAAKGLAQKGIKGAKGLAGRGMKGIGSKAGRVLAKGAGMAGKLASRAITPLVGLGGTAYGTYKAQEEYGDVLGEDMSLKQKIGMGTLKGLSAVTMGLSDKFMNTDKIKEKRAREIKQSENLKNDFITKISGTMTPGALEIFNRNLTEPVAKFKSMLDAGTIIKHNKMWYLYEELPAIVKLQRDHKEIIEFRDKQMEEYKKKAIDSIKNKGQQLKNRYDDYRTFGGRDKKREMVSSMYGMSPDPYMIDPEENRRRATEMYGYSPGQYAGINQTMGRGAIEESMGLSTSQYHARGMDKLGIAQDLGQHYVSESGRKELMTRGKLAKNQAAEKLMQLRDSAKEGSERRKQLDELIKGGKEDAANIITNITNIFNSSMENVSNMAEQKMNQIEDAALQKVLQGDL